MVVLLRTPFIIVVVKFELLRSRFCNTKRFNLHEHFIGELRSVDREFNALHFTHNYLARVSSGRTFNLKFALHIFFAQSWIKIVGRRGRSHIHYFCHSI